MRSHTRSLGDFGLKSDAECRLSSDGRDSSKRELLEFVARKLELFASPGDTIVDFSCGSNEFLPIFKRECLKQGKFMLGRAFDAISPRIHEDFEQTTWLDVPPGGLTGPSGHRCR